jgi:hypothetical protein
VEDGIHPLAAFQDSRGNVPCPWAVKPWVVYLFSDEDVVRCVDYAHENLIRARMTEQAYSFVVPYKIIPGAAHRR